MDYKNKKAKAALFTGAERAFTVQEFPLSPPEKGRALLKLIASGICGTDIHIYHGRLEQPAPLILGHEFIGEIVDINSDSSKFKIGDRVIYNMAKPCGKCKLCQTGDSANCLAFEVGYARNPMETPHFFGGFAEYCYAAADTSALIRLPDGVDGIAASLFPCAGPTIIHALKLGGLFAAKAAHIENAVVQGAGPLGLFSALWLSLCGVPNIYVVLREKDSTRAKLIMENTDAKICTDDEIKKLAADGFSTDLCIECSGSPSAFETGCQILRNRGIYLVPGQYSDSGNISFAPQIITFKALQIIGSSQYDANDVKDYIDFLSTNSETVKALSKSVKTYHVDEINQAIEAAGEHRYSKVVLTY